MISWQSFFIEFTDDESDDQLGDKSSSVESLSRPRPKSFNTVFTERADVVDNAVTRSASSPEAKRSPLVEKVFLL